MWFQLNKVNSQSRKLFEDYQGLGIGKGMSLMTTWFVRGRMEPSCKEKRVIVTRYCLCS